ncbi:MAG: hypothetical protein J5631_14005, partial [Spirochaetaceae bacterium]|nr:hypothetical protein [Spirochaetaceae bacterium]
VNQTFYVGDQLPFGIFFQEKKEIFTKIHKRITVYDLYFDLGENSQGIASERKGGYQPTEFKYKKRKIPVLYQIVDIDEEKISLRLCGIEKKFLNKYKKNYKDK